MSRPNTGSTAERPTEQGKEQGIAWDTILRIIGPVLFVLGVVILIGVQIAKTGTNDAGQEPHALPTAQISAPPAAATTAGPVLPSVSNQREGRQRVSAPEDDLARLPTIEAVNCAAPATEGERVACQAHLAPIAPGAPPTHRPAAAPPLSGSEQRGGGAAAAPAPVVPALVPLTEGPAPACSTAAGSQCTKSKPDRRP